MKCSLCNKVLVWHGGTSNLRSHLAGQHPLQYTRREDDNSKKQPPITSCFSAAFQSNVSQIGQRPSQTLLLLWSTVTQGPQQLCLESTSRLRWPIWSQAIGCPQIVTSGEKKYLLVRSKLEVFLCTLDCNVSLISDFWTSSVNDAYLSATAHFIMDD